MPFKYLMKNNYSPVVLFTYIRLKKLKKIIESLKRTDIAKKSDIFFFSDNAKSKLEINRVNKVRKYIASIKGFKKKKIILRTKNFGNGKNIIDGINYVFKKYETAIILEDDLEIGENFLSFMNLCLKKYASNKNIWHIGGWTFDLKRRNNYDIFFSKNMNCWGWATWKNRWKLFKKDPHDLINNFTRNNIKKFDFNDSGLFWSQIIKNANNEINTWAIFWYATIFKKKKLSCNPIKSYIRNIGMDGSGMHCADNNYLNDHPLYCFENIELVSKPFLSNKFNLMHEKYFKAQKKNFYIKMMDRVKNKFRPSIF